MQCFRPGVACTLPWDTALQIIAMVTPSWSALMVVPVAVDVPNVRGEFKNVFQVLLLPA